MRIELLYFDDCPSHEALLPALREVLAVEGIEDGIELAGSRLRRTPSASVF